MSRFLNMMSGSGAGRAAGSGVSMKDFIKKNPNYMKMTSDERKNAMTDFREQTRAMNMAAKMAGGGSYGFQLPGTAEPSEGDMTKGAQAMMEKILLKQAAKMAAKRAKVEAIRATWFKGGRIDAKGNIYNAQNKVVGSINTKTGKVWIGNSSLGAYKDSSYFLTKLERHLAAKTPAAGATQGGLGSFYSGTGSIYGPADKKDSWW